MNPDTVNLDSVNHEVENREQASTTLLQQEWAPSDARLKSLIKAFIAESLPVYIVGGTVRDAMINRARAIDCLDTEQVDAGKPADIDISLPSDACRISRRVADREGWAFYKLDAERDVARLVWNDAEPPLMCDIARFQGESLREDLSNRDFTINAMAFALDEDWGQQVDENEAASYAVTLVDDHGGLSDLEARQIRRVDEQSLVRDPVRLLRAVRFSAQLSQVEAFEIEAETRRQIMDNAASIGRSSHERIRDELWKALAAARPDAVIEELRILGLLPIILPEVAKLVSVPQSSPHHLDVYEHTLAAVRHAGFLRDWILRDNKASSNNRAAEFAHDELTGSASQIAMLEILEPWQERLRTHFCYNVAVGHLRVEWLVWLALFHDVGKPATRTQEEVAGTTRQRFFEHEHVGAAIAAERLAQLRFSRDEIKLATRVIESHMRPHHLHASFEGGAVSRRASYRFFRDAGRIQDNSPVGIDVVLLALADMQAIHAGLNVMDDDTVGPPTTGRQLTAGKQEVPEFWTEYLEHAESLIEYGLGDHGDSALRDNRLITGHQLIAQFGMKPGPKLGHVLEQLSEAQAAGEIETEEEALDWVANLLPKISE